MRASKSDIEAPERAVDTVPEEAGLLGRIIDRIGHIFCFVFVISMSVLIFEIFMRYVLHKPTIWAHETTIFLCGTGFIFGGLFCAARNKHIRVVPVYDNVPQNVRKWLDVVIYFTCAVSTAFFSYAAWLVVERAIFAPGGGIHLETSGSAWNPPTPAMLKMFLFFGMCVLTVLFLTFAANHLRKNLSGGSTDND